MIRVSFVQKDDNGKNIVDQGYINPFDISHVGVKNNKDGTKTYTIYCEDITAYEILETAGELINKIHDKHPSIPFIKVNLDHIHKDIDTAYVNLQSLCLIRIHKGKDNKRTARIYTTSISFGEVTEDVDQFMARVHNLLNPKVIDDELAETTPPSVAPAA